MQWIAPSEKDNHAATFEMRLWEDGDQFRANSGPKFQKYSASVLGLVNDIRRGGSISSCCCDQHDASDRFDSKITNRAACN